MHRHAGLAEREGQEGPHCEQRNQPVGDAAERRQQRSGAGGEE